MTDTGYRVHETVLTADECETLIVALSNYCQTRGRAGTRHLMKTPEVAALATDTRLLQIVRQELGDEAVPYRATLFEKSGRANWLVVWHQDTALPLESHFSSEEWGPWSKKAGIFYAHAPAWALNRILALRIHLDESSRNNGPLRVIPNSHRYGVLTDEEVFHLARKEPYVECIVSRGSILAMRPLIVHSSSKARLDAPRRVIHIEYAKSLELKPGIRLASA